MSKKAHITTLSFLIVIGFVHLVQSQSPSPCPEIFSYEPRGQEQDRWYGVLSLQTKEDLNGVWIHVSLDRPAELLGNWFGEATSSDNQDFAIKNPKYKLEAGPPVSVRFFVKYNAASTVPSLTSVRLNGKTICTTKKEETTTHTPQLHISQHVRPSNQPASSNNGGSVSTNHNQRPTNTRRPTPSTSSENDNYDSNFGNTNSRPTNSRPSNNRPTNSRPTNINYGTTDDNEDDTVNYGSNSNFNNQGSHNQNQNQNQRRPSGGSNSNGGNFGNNGNHRGQQNSGTSSSNGLSVESEDSSTQGGFDYFPGDFAVHQRPIQTRPGSNRPSSVNKRSVGCGTVAMRASPLISHGQNTTQGQWPWHVALYHSQGIQLMYTCGATLISENHVITAAHCVTKPQTNRAISPSNLLAYLGKHNLKKFGSEIQDREISDIYVHPQYNYSVYFNDVAVLKLARPVDVTNYVRPCCLWEGGSDLDDIENHLGTVVGWGFDENRRLSNSLMQAQMPVVSTVKCIYSNREFFSQFTFEKNYCAGFKNGTSVCNGDSGGGMVFPKPGTSGQNTVWQIRGLVSVGVALQGQGVCDPSQYIVFTDVAKHLDWIKRVMEQ